jgi:hypothetical protein
MKEIVWVGPGFYKILSFAVGASKVVMVSANQNADLPDCFWCETLEEAQQRFNPKPVIYGKRETY